MYKRFVFKKEYVLKDGNKLPLNSEIDIINNAFYFKGGMLSPDFQVMFKNMLSDKNFVNEYLKEVAIPYNKV